MAQTLGAILCDLQFLHLVRTIIMVLDKLRSCAIKPISKLRESRVRHGLGGGKVSSATGLTVDGRKEDLVQSDLFDSMFISYIWGETRYCGVGGNNRSSIMECITKNETYVREARFVLLCSSSLNLPKCADVRDSSGTSLSNLGEWVWSVLWLMGSIVLTVWREVGSRI